MVRTPGTGERCGMSVGIDWTSHALHCGDDSVRVRLANNNKRQRESEMMMSESGCFMFSCSRLWLLCVFVCKGQCFL